MNYYKIGQRIRKVRKARRMSQEELAERVGISTTHMSHIETGNTKLSLQVFVMIAEALAVQTDSLLYDEPAENVSSIRLHTAALLDDCSSQQIQIIYDTIKALKQSLDIHAGT